MSLVSVITPAYNASSYLADTIRSVQSQTYTDWEMIIVDDCSKDDTYSIALAFAQADNRIKVIRHQENGGVAVARNTALDAAKGQYIAFLDSDDLWMPDKLEKQISYMKIMKVSFTYSSYQMMNESGKKLDWFVRSKSKITYRELLRNTLVGCLTVMVDLKEVGTFHMPSISHAEDTMTWVEILKRGYIAHGLPDSLAIYRLSSSSLSGNKLKSARYQWKVYRQYCKFNFFKSVYYFSCYAFNGLVKYLKK